MRNKLLNLNYLCTHTYTRVKYIARHHITINKQLGGNSDYNMILCGLNTYSKRQPLYETKYYILIREKKNRRVQNVMRRFFVLKTLICRLLTVMAKFRPHDTVAHKLPSRRRRPDEYFRIFVHFGRIASAHTSFDSNIPGKFITGTIYQLC